MTTSKCWPHRGPYAKHQFDSISGWCVYGCGRRDDGYLINITSASTISPAPEYTPEQLASFAAHARIAAQPAHPTLHLE